MAEFEDFFRSRFDEAWREQIKEMSRLYPLHEPTVVTEDERSSPTTITADTFISGDISGDVLVESKVHVRIKGDVSGNLVVKPQAVVQVEGDIAGDVVAMGSSLLVEGDIGGNVRIQPR